MPETALVLGSVGLAGWLYARGLSEVWGRAGTGRVVHRWQAGAFAVGLVVLVATLVGPLAELAHERLWAHMLQHMILVAIAAPLLVLGNPLAAMLSAVPGRLGRNAMWWRRLSRSHNRPVGWVAWAASALLVSTVSLWVWHAPGPYQAALGSDWLHALQHASFLGTALFFWWAVIGARKRSLYGPGVLFVFVAAVQGTLLGTVMALASRPWYPAYARVADGGLSPMQDQQVAGVIMWGPTGAVYALAAVLLFAAWLGGPGAESDAGAAHENAQPEDRPAPARI